MEGVCLCLDLDEERGIFSLGWRPSASRFSKAITERGHKTLIPAALTQSRASRGSAVPESRLTDGPLHTSAAPT